MSTGVEFEGDKYASSRPGIQQNFSNGMSGGDEPSKFAKWLMEKGIVKTESGAQGVLIGIVVVNIIITIVVFIKFL